MHAPSLIVCPVGHKSHQVTLEKYKGGGCRTGAKTERGMEVANLSLTLAAETRRENLTAQRNP